MAHFTDPSRTWPLGLTDISSSLGDMDARAKKTVNGVLGEPTSFAPSAPIILGGEGLALQSPIAWNVPKTYTRKVSAYRYVHDTLVPDAWTTSFGTFTGLQAASTSQKMVVPLCPELIDRATLNRVRAYFLVSGSRGSQAIGAYPKLWVSRRNELTGDVDALTFSGSNIFATPGSWAAYQNAGVPNILTFTPDNALSTAVIDLSTYSYSLEYVDDTGATGPFNMIVGFEVRMSNVVDMGQP